MAKAKAPEHVAINWRSRIVRYGKINASQITPHPQNPRRHPVNQRQAVAASFDELGQLAPVIINANNGYLVDGEERSWLALDQPGDVELDAIWVDLTDAEHLKALAYLDATSALAIYDAERLDELLRDVSTDSAAVQQMLSELVEKAGVVDLPDQWQEYDETVADDVEYCTCPSCGHKFPK